MESQITSQCRTQRHTRFQEHVGGTNGQICWNFAFEAIRVLTTLIIIQNSISTPQFQADAQRCTLLNKRDLGHKQ